MRLMQLKKKLIYLLVSFCISIAVASDSKTITVVLDWFPNPNHAPLFVAEQEGFFKEQGLKVSFISPADAVQGGKMVAVGKADLAVTYHPALLHHVVNGLPLVRIATLINKPLACLVLNKDILTIDTKCKSVACAYREIKKVGYSGTEIEKVMFSIISKKIDLNLNQVRLVNIGFNLMPALLVNQIDGFIGGMRNFEPLAIKEYGQSLEVLYPEDFGFPKYEELILVANKNKIDDPSFKKFIIALTKGVNYLKQNSEQSWQKFVKKHPNLNNSLNKKSWFITVNYFSDNPVKLNRELYKDFADFAYKERIIWLLPKLNDYLVEL